MYIHTCILINGILSGGIPHKNKALLGSYTANGNKSVHSIKDRGISQRTGHVITMYLTLITMYRIAVKSNNYKKIIKAKM